jgi:hypothetical protein
MAVPGAIRRLHQVLKLEEEEARRALQTAVDELRRLECALARAVEQERAARRLVAHSAHTGELLDRLAALEESGAAGRRSAWLRPLIPAAEQEAASRRQQFLAKRVERRQVETLIRAAEARAAAEAARRAQQTQDERFLSRMRERAARKS